MSHSPTDDSAASGAKAAPRDASPSIPDAPDPNEPPRARRPIRDTVILPNADIFDSLGIKTIPPREFAELADIISRHFGIHIGENKITMVTGRIHPIMEKHGFASHREYIDAIRGDASGELVSELANRISTNHTAFYREETHFKLLADAVLPEIAKRKSEAGGRDLRIWCAACSTGEEAYTILFTLLKFFNFDYKSWRAGVLATDISASALEAARRGVYPSQKIASIPRDVLGIYFQQIDEDQYEVRPEYRKEVTFRRLNLMNESYPFKQRFDMIFCRNVMIYFSRGNRMRLLDRLRDWLVPGGYLFVGHSESLVGNHEGLAYAAPAVYVRDGRTE